MEIEDIFNDRITARQIEIDQIIREFWIVIEPFSGKLYTINDDGSIDVDGSVKFPKVCNFITQLPLTFNKVSGNFDCSKLSLTTLKGSPKEVGGYFDCSYNNLASLEFSPKTVKGSFVFDNMVSSLFTGEISCNFIDVVMRIRTNTPGVGIPEKILQYSSYLSTIFKYQNYYDVWDVWDDLNSINEENFDGLIEDIKDGLE